MTSISRNLNKEDADTKAKADAEAKRVAEAKRLTEEKAGAEAGAAAKTSAVESRQLQEQALAEIKARCDKAETRDDINAIKDSFLLYPELSQNEKFLRECHGLLQTAGKRVEEIAIGQELQGKILAEVQTQSAQANSLADIQRVEHWMREQLGKIPVPNPAWEKQLAGFVTEARKRMDANFGALADWAGVKEEQVRQLGHCFHRYHRQHHAQQQIW